MKHNNIPQKYTITDLIGKIKKTIHNRRHENIRPEKSPQTGIPQNTKFKGEDRPYDIDDLLCDISYLSEGNTYPLQNADDQDNKFLETYHITTNEENINIGEKGISGNLITLGGNMKATFNQNNEEYTKRVSRFFTLIREFYKENTPKEVYEREKQFIKQHPKTEILNTLTKEKE